MNDIMVIVGAGPGLGNALITRFAESKMRVAAVSCRGLAGETHRDLVRGYSCDAPRGMIASENSVAAGLLQPAAFADSYYHLHRQDRSAWTHELDQRPGNEKF